MSEIDPFKRFAKRTAGAILPLMAVVACSHLNEQSAPTDTRTPRSSSTTTAAPTSTTSPRSGEAPVRFQKRPETNFAVNNCHNVSDTWANSIDSQPRDVEDQVTTVGMVSGYEADGQQPVLLAGITYRGLGKYQYEVSTSDEPDTSQILDLKPGSEGHAEILKAEVGNYAIVFTAINGEDGRTYFRTNCLPNFDFYGDKDKTFVPDLPPITPPPENRAIIPTVPKGTTI